MPIAVLLYLGFGAGALLSQAQLWGWAQAGVPRGAVVLLVGGAFGRRGAPGPLDRVGHLIGTATARARQWPQSGGDRRQRGWLRSGVARQRRGWRR